MAMAARYERGLLDPTTAIGKSLFDHTIWVICSDGDLQEGVSAEASSLAGTQELGHLVMIYDDNRISIEGDTHNAFTEDVAARYCSYGWQVIDVPAAADGRIDLPAVDAAMISAKAELTKPSLIRMHSVIAWPAPKAKGTAGSHGSALGAEEIAETKKILGLNPDEHFALPADVFAHVRKVKERGSQARKDWDARLKTWQASNPKEAALLKRLQSKELPTGWDSELPVFEAGTQLATRAASGKAINALAKQMPELWGGSADLAGSNNTDIDGGGSFLPATSAIKNANPYGRIVHFGIREHAMGSILNGAALHGLTRSFGGTFLVFSDYMRPAVRLATLMNIPSTFVWTHDSIGVGEDGPTHQPIEHFAALRAIPNLDVIRPGDANEVSVAWREIITRRSPAAIILSRQNLPVVDRTTHASASEVAKGAYVLKAASDKAKVTLVATGSEVSLALDVAATLEAKSISTAVVSAPCLEWFDAQPAAYRDSVLPSDSLKVSIEAGISQGWHRYVGSNGLTISLEHYGASASAPVLFKEFGFSVEAIVPQIEAALLC
jgi:transketolase